MLKRIARFFARRIIPDELVVEKSSATQSEGLDFDPGMRDATLSGWFNGDTGELFTGFTISPEDVVVDVGCGDGGNSFFCACRGAKVIFADIDPAKVENTALRLRGTPARELVPIVSAASPLPVADGIASKVICTEVLEHVEDPARFLAELIRIGRPGAQYLLTVPDPEAEGIQKHFAPASQFEHPNHIRIIGRDEFEKMVEQSGLILERRGSYGFYWSVWWFLFWACKQQELAPPWQPALQYWNDAWGHVLTTENGPRIKRVLDNYLPKSQLIIARKPY